MDLLKSAEDVRQHQDGTSLTVAHFDRDIHLPRLRRLAEHLEEVWRRDPGSFNLETWFSATDATASRLKETKILQHALDAWPERWAAGESLNCGTSACLVGHLPLIFPDDFEWNIDNRMVLAQFAEPEDNRTGATPEHLRYYFALSRLFWAGAIYPENDYWVDEDGHPGSPNAAEVASLIRAAIEVAEAETKP